MFRTLFLFTLISSSPVFATTDVTIIKVCKTGSDAAQATLKIWNLEKQTEIVERTQTYDARQPLAWVRLQAPFKRVSFDLKNHGSFHIACSIFQKIDPVAPEAPAPLTPEHQVQASVIRGTR